jgi:hypothetical protein
MELGMSLSKVKTGALEARALRILKDLEASKALYAELDEITEALVKRKWRKSKYLKLRNNFAAKNTAWRSVAVRMFDIDRL